MKRAVLSLRVCIFCVYLLTVISMNFGQRSHYHNNVHNESNWTNIWLSRPPSVVELKLNFFTTVVHQRSNIMITYDERNCCYIWEFLVKYRKLTDRGLIGTAIVFDRWNRILVSDPNFTRPLSERALYRLLSPKKRVVPIVLSCQLVDTLISPGIEPATQTTVSWRSPLKQVFYSVILSTITYAPLPRSS